MIVLFLTLLPFSACAQIGPKSATVRRNREEFGAGD